MKRSTETDVFIYLAGKITKNGWRSKYVKGLRGAYTDSDQADGTPWPILYDALGDGLHYVGPYFVACDHGCTHGTESHATLGGCVTARGEFGPHVVWKHAGDDDGVRYNVARTCMSAVRMADVVIAVVGDDTHGTLVEVGYALGLGKRVILARNEQRDVEDLEVWFPYALCETSFTVGHAVERVAKEVGFARQRRLCESPIEVQFFDAMQGRQAMVGFVPQLDVEGGRFRLDFGDPARMVGIELDGYEHHSSRDQFTKDRERQRQLELMGWRILRFSGREVHQDARKCVDQAIDWLKAVA